MVKKSIWYEKDGRYREKNLSANRIALNHIRKNIGTRKFNVTEFQEGLGIGRETAHDWLRSLRRTGFLNSKVIGARQMLDNREYKLSLKGKTKLPRKKGVEIEPEIREVEVEKRVEVEKLNQDKFLGEV